MARIKIEEKNGYAKDGWYMAKFIRCKELGIKDTRWGSVNTGLLQFKLDNGAVISQYTYLVNWNKALCVKLMKAVDKGLTECELSILAGKEVAVEVKNNITLTGMYTNVIDIVSKEEGKEKIKEQSRVKEESILGEPIRRIEIGNDDIDFGDEF